MSEIDPRNPGSQPAQKESGHPLANYQFSPEELRALKECNTESFFQRSLPLGTSFGLAAYVGCKRGTLSSSARFGPAPKVVMGVIFGYFLGKFSYQRKCAEKLMRLPNSHLAELLKQRKRGGIMESLTPDQGFGSGLALPQFGGANDHYTDEFIKQDDKNRTNSLDLDFDRPSLRGLDESQRPSLDSPEKNNLDEELNLEQSKVTMSYDELRNKNRDEYRTKMQNPYNKPIAREESQVIIRSPPEKDEYVAPKGPKNKYGDTWSG